MTQMRSSPSSCQSTYWYPVYRSESTHWKPVSSASSRVTLVLQENNHCLWIEYFQIDVRPLEAGVVRQQPSHL